jgi:hypothetical protein
MKAAVTLTTFARRDPVSLRATQRDAANAFCDGAAILTRAGNRVAAIALLWTAVGADPIHFVAHRRLAASLANAGDAAGAGAEYARYIGLIVKRGEVIRAAAELNYARATLGDLAELRAPGQFCASLDDIATALVKTVQTPHEAPLPSHSAHLPIAPTLSRGFAFRSASPPARLGPA